MAKPPIRIKRSAVSGAIPTTAQLALGELAINTADGKVFLKKDDGTESIVEIGAGGGGGAYTSPSALALYEKSNSGTPDSFDGVETRFQLRDTSGGLVTIANALYVAISVNGVVQKPNTGTPSSPFEGFYITNNASAGYDIVFDTAPSSGADFFGVLAGTFTATGGTSGIKILDDISSQFNGSLTAFTLQYNAATYTPDFPNAIVVSLGGVVQIPTDAYSISGSTITFTAAPPSGTSFHALSFEIGEAVDGVTEVTATTPLSSTGGTTPIISIQDGTTTQKGAVQLEDSTSSTSTTKAATPNSVKTAYDLADAALPKSGGTMTGDIVFNAGQTIDGYVSETSSTGSAQLPSGTTAERDASPAAGYIRYNTETGSFEGYGTAWGAIGGGAAVTTGETAPSNPSDGDLWYDTSTSGGGRTYVYYDDGNTSQWVDAAPQGAGGPYGLGSASAPSITFLNDSNTGIYSPGADQLAISTNSSGRLFVDSSGNIGINTSSILSPGGFGYAKQLGITGDTSGDSSVSLNLRGSRTVDGSFADINFWHQSTSNRSWIAARREGADADVNLAFGTKNSERLRITAAGLVGIGTSVPDYALHVSGAGGTIGSMVSANSSTIRYTNTNTTAAWSAGTSSPGLENAGNYYAITQLGTDLTWRDRLRIDSSGRVGIGTNTPSEVLTLNNSGYPLISFKDNGTLRGQIGYTFDYGYFHVTSESNLAFRANGSERARIDSSGRLLVGTSSASGGTNAKALIAGNTNSAPGVLLIASTSTTPASGDNLGVLRFSDAGHVHAGFITCDRDGGTWTSGSSQPSRLTFSVTQDGQASPTGRFWIVNGGYSYFQSIGQGAAFATTQGAGTSFETILAGHTATNGTFNSINVSFRVFSNGNVQNTNNSYGAISDLKLKENIVNANTQWDDIKALQVRNYNFKEGQTHTQIGLVAQEVELVSPGLVTESPDRDAEGNDLGTVTKSVNYSVLYMKAVKALQEAMERIETLEAKVAALESA